MSSQLINDDLEYKDNSYATKGNEPIPVQKDDAKLEDPISGDQDSDAQLSMIHHPIFKPLSDKSQTAMTRMLLMRVTSSTTAPVVPLLRRVRTASPAMRRVWDPRRSRTSRYPYSLLARMDMYE